MLNGWKFSTLQCSKKNIRAWVARWRNIIHRALKIQSRTKKTSSQISYLDLFMGGGAWFQSRGVENAIKSPPTCSAPNMSGMQLIRLGKQNRFKFFVIRAKSLSLYLFFKSAICASYSCWVLTFAIVPWPCSGMELSRGFISSASPCNEAPLCWFCLLKTWGKAPTPPSDTSIRKVWKWNVLSRGGICPCRHCRRQCRIFASGVNFSIFTHFFVFSH